MRRTGFALLAPTHLVIGDTLFDTDAYQIGRQKQMQR
jgi:hypothetical protein